MIYILRNLFFTPITFFCHYFLSLSCFNNNQPFGLFTHTTIFYTYDKMKKKQLFTFRCPSQGLRRPKIGHFLTTWDCVGCFCTKIDFRPKKRLIHQSKKIIFCQTLFNLSIHWQACFVWSFLVQKGQLFLWIYISSVKLSYFLLLD